MSLSADVAPFVSGQVFHGNSPNQYPIPQNVNTQGYIAAGPQVGAAPPSVPNGSNQAGYQPYMVNCYPYVTETGIPQDGRQQGFGPTQAAATPYSMPQTNHPYPHSNPYDGYQQAPQMYQAMPEQQGIAYQDPYYSASYYPNMPSQNIQQQMTSVPTYQGHVPPPAPHGPSYTPVQPAMQYQVPYSQPQNYPISVPQSHQNQGRHKHYSGNNKHKNQRYNSDQSNVGCEAVAAELDSIKKKKTVVYTEVECQTDFPEHIANKTLSERPIEELVPGARAVTKSTGNQTGEEGGDSSSESGGEEEEETRPQDSDSGYSGMGAYPPVTKRDGTKERRDWSSEGPAADSGSKSYASVASQRYGPPHQPHPPQQPHLSPYQQQWPLPPSAMMNGQQVHGAPMKGPVNSFAGMVSHQPSQQQQPQGASQGYAMGPLHHHPQMPYQAQAPPMQAQPMQQQQQQQMVGMEAGMMRPRQDNKKVRKGKKKSEAVWLQQSHQHPPPMINDSSEYPELPVAPPVAWFRPDCGGYPRPPSFSNIAQQKLMSTVEVDSDTSSEKDGHVSGPMVQSEDMKGKILRKKNKKLPQDFQDQAVTHGYMPEPARNSGKRSQRTMEIELVSALNRTNQTPQPSPYGPVMYGAGVPYGNQPPLMPYQQNPKWGVGPMNSLPNNRVPPMQRDKLGLKKSIGLNPLDSSAPVMKGKMKENPIKKKPSAMKKVIIAERLEKRRMKDLQEKKLSDNEDALTQSTADLDSSCYDSRFALSQDAPSDRNSLSINTSHSDLSPFSQPDPLSLSPPSPAMNFSVSSGGSNSSQSEVLALKRIHSNKWREYCKQIISKDIDNCCTTLLQTLVRFQERQYNRDGPIKAKAKRRIVMGLREVSKHLKKKKITCIIISTNLEKIQSKGGIDDVLQNITETAQEQGVPVVFALCRSSLGRAVNKIVPVSVVGVFNHNGAEDIFKQLIGLVNAAREEYQMLLLEQRRDIEKKSKNIGKHLGHRRNISNCSGISFNSFISEPISENDPEPEPDLDEEEYNNNNSSSSSSNNNTRDEDPQEEAKSEEIVDTASSHLEESASKTNSEASACTVEDQQRKQLVSSQDQSCRNIEEEEEEAQGEEENEEDEDDDEEEEEEEEEDEKDEEYEDSEAPLAPEVSATERVNNWVAETQVQVGNLSIGDE
ncbi:uncharacterized protein [Apostichopus japonicus]|uniref:uncharacterized protein isoform X2 n=1 Tax=Stichopus japonicus TaxID=307972 RepID=UPI003AB912ED